MNAIDKTIELPIEDKKDSSVSLLVDNTAMMTNGESKQSPGTLLISAREKLGLTQRQVAEKLHLLPRQVEALETNDYQQFNGEIFCKGYLKSYALVVGIKHEPLIAAYLQLRPEPVVKDKIAPKNTSHVQRPHKGRSIQYWFMAASVVVIALLWIYGSDNTLDTTAESPAIAEVVVDKSEKISPEILKTAQSVQLLAAESSSTTSIDQVTKPAASETNLQLDAAQEKTPDSVSAPVVDNAKDLLSFTFSSDCWVRVKDKNGQVVFADLKRAGDSLELSGDAPFQVLLGFAPGVSIKYKGEPVNIAVNQKDNSAQLLIGE